MRPRALLVALAVLLALLVARTASANIAAPYSTDPAARGGPLIVKPTPLVVVSERLSFRCGESDHRPSCTFDAVYHVKNPTSGREEVLGAYYGVASENVHIQADGASAVRELTPVELGQMDDAMKAIDPSLAGVALVRTGFGLAVDPGQEKDLSFGGRLLPIMSSNAERGYEFALPPILMRHPFLASTIRDDGAFDFEYLLSPLRSWAGDPTVDITVRYPSAWDLSAEGFAEGQAWTRTSDGGDDVDRIQIRSSADTKLSMRFTIAGSHLLNGGPVAGIGPRLDSPEVRARFAWEFGGPPYVLYQLGFETNFTGRATVVPTIEAATPGFIFVPSLGLGVGVPVQYVNGRVYPGGRAIVEISFPIVSLLIPIDFFPGLGAPDTGQVALVIQASF